MANLSNINNKFIVESDGDVGIGVTTALDKLNVGDGNIRISQVGNVASQLILNTYQSALGNSLYNWFLQQTTSANSYSFQIGMVGSNPYLHINSVLFGATAGNVGIGTDSPDSKLDVKGTSATPADGNQILSITNTTGGTQLNLGTAENSYGWIEAREGATLRNLLLNPNGGNVGIATSSPDRVLDVRGNGLSIYGSGDNTELMLRGQVEGTGTVRNVGAFHLSIRSDVGGDNDDLKFLRFVTGTYSGIAMQIQNTTGTIIGNGIYTSGNSIKIFEAQRDGGAVKSDWSYDDATTDMSLGTSTAHSFSLKTGNTRALTINSSQNVGIGTASPSAKLEIVTAVGADAIRLNFGQSADIFLGFNSANPRILLQDNSNVVTHNFQSNGDNYIVGNNVGIGTTSPDCKLTVAGSGSGGVNPSTISSNTVATFRRTGGVSHNANISILAGTSGASILNFGDRDNEDAGIITYTHDSGGSDTMAFTVGTSEKMRIINSGNVGIGITIPQDKLHVDGDAIISSNRYGDYAVGGLDTTGVVVATVTGSGNGASASIEFVGMGGVNGIVDVVYNCTNQGGNWYVYKNERQTASTVDVVATGNGTTTLTFTFKAISSSQGYTPRIRMIGSPYNLITF